MRILLDNNAIDKMSNHLSFIKNHTEIEFFICREVVGEVCQNKFYNPTMNISSLLKAGVKYLPNTGFIIGHSLLDGESTLSSNLQNKVYYNILNKTKSNISDAIIASTAHSYNCILLTYDKKLYKKMKKFNYQVTTFEELENGISYHIKSGTITS